MSTTTKRKVMTMWRGSTLADLQEQLNLVLMGGKQYDACFLHATASQCNTTITTPVAAPHAAPCYDSYMQTLQQKLASISMPGGHTLGPLSPQSTLHAGPTPAAAHPAAVEAVQPVAGHDAGFVNADHHVGASLSHLQQMGVDSSGTNSSGVMSPSTNKEERQPRTRPAAIDLHDLENQLAKINTNYRTHPASVSLGPTGQPISSQTSLLASPCDAPVAPTPTPTPAAGQDGAKLVRKVSRFQVMTVEEGAATTQDTVVTEPAPPVVSPVRRGRFSVTKLDGAVEPANAISNKLSVSADNVAQHSTHTVFPPRAGPFPSISDTQPMPGAGLNPASNGRTAQVFTTASIAGPIASLQLLHLAPQPDTKECESEDGMVEMEAEEIKALMSRHQMELELLRRRQQDELNAIKERLSTRSLNAPSATAAVPPRVAGTSLEDHYNYHTAPQSPTTLETHDFPGASKHHNKLFAVGSNGLTDGRLSTVNSDNELGDVKNSNPGLDGLQTVSGEMDAGESAATTTAAATHYAGSNEFLNYPVGLPGFRRVSSSSGTLYPMPTSNTNNKAGTGYYLQAAATPLLQAGLRVVQSGNNNQSTDADAESDNATSNDCSLDTPSLDSNTPDNE